MTLKSSGSEGSVTGYLAAGLIECRDCEDRVCQAIRTEGRFIGFIDTRYREASDSHDMRQEKGTNFT